MSADPTRLLARIPDAYEKRQYGPDGQLNRNWLLMNAFSAGTEDLNDAMEQYKNNLTIATANQQGLDWIGAEFYITRPTWMPTEQYRTILQAWSELPMCSLYKIKRIYDLWTGTTCTIQDYDINASVPKGEIWITEPADANDLNGSWFAPGVTLNRSGFPVSSGIAGEINAQSGKWGGMFNDHIKGPDSYLRWILNRIKAAGTRIVYN